jgi:hypothetical protein
MPKTRMTMTQAPIVSHRFQSIMSSSALDISCLSPELWQRSEGMSLRYWSRCPVEKKVTHLRKNAALSSFAHGEAAAWPYRHACQTCNLRGRIGILYKERISPSGIRGGGPRPEDGEALILLCWWWSSGVRRVTRHRNFLAALDVCPVMD